MWCPFYSSVCLPSSMRCFFVSFLSSGFLPSGCLFPCPLSLSSWSLRVSCFLWFPHFHWALLRLSCLSSRLVCFAIGLFFPCSFPVPRSSSSRFLSPCCCWCLCFHPWPGGPFSVVSPLPGWFVSFGCCSVLFLLRCCSLPSLSSVFFCAMCVSSFPQLPCSLRTLLGTLVGILPGLFRCVLSVLGVFLLLVLLLFLPVLVPFVSPHSLSRVFSEGLLVSLRSLLLGVFLFFCFCWEFFVFFFGSCLFLSFVLIACGVSRFMGFSRDTFLFFPCGRFLFLFLCLPFIFT